MFFLPPLNLASFSYLHCLPWRPQNKLGGWKNEEKRQTKIKKREKEKIERSGSERRKPLALSLWLTTDSSLRSRCRYCCLFRRRCIAISFAGSTGSWKTTRWSRKMQTQVSLWLMRLKSAMPPFHSSFCHLLSVLFSCLHSRSFSDSMCVSFVYSCWLFSGFWLAFRYLYLWPRCTCNGFQLSPPTEGV